jgi:hypothetical protein
LFGLPEPFQTIIVLVAALFVVILTVHKLGAAADFLVAKRAHLNALARRHGMAAPFVFGLIWILLGVGLWVWIRSAPSGKPAAIVLRVQLNEWERQGRETHYRLVVYNPGPGVAENVEAALLGVDPRPSDPMFRGRFPYRLPNSLGEMKGTRVNEKGEEVYDLLHSWLNAEGFRTVLGVDGWDARRPIRMSTDEAFTLHIRVSAANAEAHDEHVLVQAPGNGLSVTLKSSGSSNPQ